MFDVYMRTIMKKIKVYTTNLIKLCLKFVLQVHGLKISKKH